MCCSNSTWLDVVSDDAYVLITVRTSVFMPEANHVAEFMYHNAKLIAILSYGDGLRAATSSPHVGATPAAGNTSELDKYLHIANQESEWQLYLQVQLTADNSRVQPL